MGKALGKGYIKSTISLLDMPIEELEAYRNQQVKVANQKMRRLEKWADAYDEKNPAHPTKVKQFAYSQYSAENKRLYGADSKSDKGRRGKEKVSGSTEKDRQKLIHQLKTAQKFLNATSSSGTQYLTKGKRTARTLKETYGIDITVDDLNTFFTSPEYARYRDKFIFNSDEALISIGNKQAELKKEGKTLEIKDWKKEYFQNRGAGRTLGVRKTMGKPDTERHLDRM